jgi:hypothetical protein
MYSALPRFETGDTRQFSVVYSAAPSTPLLTIVTRSGDGLALVHSALGVSSNVVAFYAYFTMPASLGLYYTTWVASFTAGPIVLRDRFRVVNAAQV